MSGIMSPSEKKQAMIEESDVEFLLKHDDAHLEEGSTRESVITRRRFGRFQFLEHEWVTRVIIVILILIIALMALPYHELPSLAARFRKPLPPPTPACSLVPQHALERLHRLPDPSIHAFHNGQPISPADVLSAHSDVCILMTVPQLPLATYYQAPVPGKGPDSIHMTVHSSEVVINLTPPKPVPGQGADLLFKQGVVIYQKEISLHHSGTYEVNAEVELSNWEWAKQWHDDHERNVTVYPTGIEESFGDDRARGLAMFVIRPAPEPRVVQSINKYPPAIRVKHGEELVKPFCTDKTPPVTGRWRAAMAFDVPGGLVDEWGMAYDSDQCQMQFYTDEDTMDCLKDKAVYVHGDSNSRRIAKSIISGGHYCHNLSHTCQDFDATEPTFKLVEAEDGGALEERPEMQYPQWIMTQDDWLNLPFGKNSHMMFSFQRALINHWGDYVRKFYDREDWSEAARKEPNTQMYDQPPFRPGIDLREGAHARSQPGKPVPDLVVIAVGTWDETYAHYYPDVEFAMQHFAKAVREAFPTSVIVVRLTHGTCCQKTYRINARYSGARFQHVNDIIREAFDIAQGEARSRDGRILLVDSEPLGATKDEAKDYKGHFVAHLRYSRIRTETQMMLNMVCEKDPRTGKAKWRGVNKGFH